ncbi:hypothetical protein [Chitinophaga japonensis]|uniref:Uncharacterized protein n=1 Tax=Chitinophaga japonensis TaxID=104662 RepID=A0A562SIE6_CHIJA|nr:hypothetical protein [Chitinophaga japonensis]TWI80958.1 hypothetical protein LX66_5563 [Chitinophaga japonensis]
MLINNLGLGPIQLGENIAAVPERKPLDAEDRKLFIPMPGPECWYKLPGNIFSLENGLGDAFPARYVFFAGGPDGRINMIQVFPDRELYPEMAVEGCLTKLFGLANVARGNLLGNESPVHYFWVTDDKTVQVYYSETFSEMNGWPYLSFWFLNDREAVARYKLVHRTWRVDKEAGPA